MNYVRSSSILDLVVTVTSKPGKAHSLDVWHKSVHSSADAPTVIKRVIDCDVLKKELTSRQQQPPPFMDTVITVKITLILILTSGPSSRAY